MTAPARHPLLRRLVLQPPLVPLLAAASFVPGFWSMANLRTLIDGIATDGFVVLGMMIVMIAGGFDLAVGSVMALAGVAAVVALPYGLAASAAAALLGGAACGALSGSLVTRLRLNPFIATLAVMVIVRGAVLSWTDTRPVVGLDDAFQQLGGGGAVPVPFLLLLVAVLLLHLLMRHRAWGQHVYAVGGDERAALMAGLPVRRIKLQCYMLSGTLAGIAGLLLAAKLGTGSPIIGEATPLTAAAAALIGGATLRGGEGTVIGAFLGLLFIGVLVNLMNGLGIPAYYQKVAIGAVLLAMVVADGLISRWRTRR